MELIILKFLRLYLATFNNGLDHQVDVWAPDAPGKFPVIYMLGGMGALFPGSIYHDMFLQWVDLQDVEFGKYFCLVWPVMVWS